MIPGKDGGRLFEIDHVNEDGTYLAHVIEEEKLNTVQDFKEKNESRNQRRTQGRDFSRVRTSCRRTHRRKKRKFTNASIAAER